MSYSAGDIEVLPGLEGIRRRPAMYIGSSGPQGAMHLLVEVVQNAVDEALAGACTGIDVTLGADDSVTVHDDGRGIPVEPHPRDGRSALEMVLTDLHSGGKFRDGAYQVSGGLHGVGLTCVNALSERLEVDVRRDGRRTTIACARGRVVEPVTDRGPAEGHGTTVSFRPDPTLFVDGFAIDRIALARHLQEQAFLHPGLRVTLTTATGTDTWRFDTGLEGFVRYLGSHEAPVHADPITFLDERDGVRVEAALWWTTGYAETICSYVNSIRTSQGGSHVEGLDAALSRVLHREAVSRGMINERDLLGADVREGLVAALSVRVRDPEFEGQTKTLLNSALVGRVVEAVVTEHLGAALAAHPEAARGVLGKVVEAGRARLAARAAGERARYRALDSVVTKEVYRQQFGIRSKNWHDSCRWLTDQTLLGAHAAMCVADPEGEALDVCCGSGVVGNSFRGKVKRIIGLDLTPQMAELARTRLDEVVLGDVYDIPFESNRFALACTREVLHLLPDPGKPVSEVFRVLKPGGQFVMGQLVPYGDADTAWFFRVIKKKQPLFFNHFLADDLIALFTQAGFVDITTSEVTQWEDIDLWIATHETPNLMRHEIRDLYHHAPAEVRAVHPFTISPEGRILDQWRWIIYSCMKPA